MDVGAYRKQRGLSLRAWARLVGVSAPSARKWEHGGRPDIDSLRKIKRVTGGQVTEEDFLEPEAAPKPEAA